MPVLPLLLALSSGGLVWSHDAGPGPSFVVLGDRGGQVLVGSDLSGIALLSSFDAHPPSPAWQSTLAGRHVAARDRDAYLLFYDAPVSGTTAHSVIHLFRSGSNVPRWSYEYPEQGLSFAVAGMSRDGRVVASVWTDFTILQHELRIHDPDTGVASAPLVLPASAFPGRLEVAPDGTFAAMSAGYDGPVLVVEIAGGSVVFSTPGSIPSRQAIAEEGRTLVVVERVLGVRWHLRVFVRDGNGYRETLDRISPFDTPPIDAVTSDDGSTVAASWYKDDQPGRSVVRAFDSATGAMTMERALGVPSLRNYPSDLAINDDGSRFVLGSFGDDTGVPAELEVFSPVRNEPIADYPVGGSVLRVDIAPDGDRLVAVRAPFHYDWGFLHLDVEMYELGGEDLVLRGRPSIGETVAFEFEAPPGATAYLLSAPRLAQEPILLPGVGTLVLGPSLLQTDEIGVVPPSGAGTHAVPIANDPTLVGRTTYHQVLTVGPRHLSEDWVQLTVLP